MEYILLNAIFLDSLLYEYFFSQVDFENDQCIHLIWMILLTPFFYL